MLRTAIFALLFAGFVHAETTIVPLRGDLVFGADGSYLTSVQVTNLSRVPVSVRRGDVFPVSIPQPCSEPITVVIQPLQSAEVPTGCRGLYAYTLESDGPIRVDTTITTLRPVKLPIGWTSSFHHQQLPAAREWLPADRIAIIPQVIIGNGGGARTNLFVTNPNDHELTFDLRITAITPSAPSRDERHVIQSRSTALIRLTNVDDPMCRVPLICGAEHTLTFTANGEYYASTSSVDHATGDALFLSPSVAEQ